MPLGRIVGPATARRQKVADDWVSVLPREKNKIFETIVGRWESSYAMMSVALDQALALRARGELVCARQQLAVAADLLVRLSHSLTVFCAALVSRGRSLRKIPVVEPLNVDFFRGNTAQSAASWNGILHTVLVRERPRFVQKLKILSTTVGQLEKEFSESSDEIVRGSSVDPGASWNALDSLHYDFSTCLRETEVLLKSFLRALPAEELSDFSVELERPPEPKRLRVRADLSGASA